MIATLLPALRHPRLAPSSICGCLDCLHPTDANADLRLAHAEAHREFASRYASLPTQRELRMWAVLRRLREVGETVDPPCPRPDHAMFALHTLAEHR